MSKVSVSIQLGAPRIFLSSIPKAIRIRVRTLVAVATKRPPGSICRFEGSLSAVRRGRIETTSNRMGWDTVNSVVDELGACDSVERGNATQTSESKRVR